MILLSELSRRRIRSITKLIRVGRIEFVVVLRVDKEKGYIDLSKRRVAPEDVAKADKKYTKAKAVCCLRLSFFSRSPLSSTCARCIRCCVTSRKYDMSSSRICTSRLHGLYVIVDFHELAHLTVLVNAYFYFYFFSLRKHMVMPMRHSSSPLSSPTKFSPLCPTCPPI
jgi:hypothetical protein